MQIGRWRVENANDTVNIREWKMKNIVQILVKKISNFWVRKLIFGVHRAKLLIYHAIWDCLERRNQKDEYKRMKNEKYSPNYSVFEGKWMKCVWGKMWFAMMNEFSIMNEVSNSVF